MKMSACACACLCICVARGKATLPGWAACVTLGDSSISDMAKSASAVTV